MGSGPDKISSLGEETMSARQILDVFKTNWKGSLRLALACALLPVFGAVLLHAQSYQDLYNFDCPTGCAPYGALTRGIDGNLYGTTSNGGSNNLGTIFKVNPAGTGYQVLWNFDTTTGAPSEGLTLESADLNFYGTTSVGGTPSYGTLYRFDSSSNTLTILHEFSSTEGYPFGPPVEGTDKNLYGVATTGPDSGAAYSLKVATATFKLLPNPLPGYPLPTLFLASDGNFYGATQSGGENYLGTVFRMTTAGAIKIVHSFSGNPDGAAPNAPLAQAKNGKLYGTTEHGGAQNEGTIFDLTLPPSSTETPLFSFDTSGGAGYAPFSGLLFATDDNFYGTTFVGGASDLGTLFEFTSGGSYIPLFDFTGNGGTVSGAYPGNTPLMEDTNGLFYGLTPSGGSDGGVFYSLTPKSSLINITLCCNWWVILDQPVTILGDNLNEVINVNFGSVAAQFQAGSSTYLTAEVPSAAIDSPVTVTLATGEQVESQQVVHILPSITNLDPSSGPVGMQVAIVGGGFAGTKKVTFGGVKATDFTVVTPALIQATLPQGAKTGKVRVVTPNGSATSEVTFTVN
jgi:uncharacterized repeat protein (TIGR03803 family)